MQSYGVIYSIVKRLNVQLTKTVTLMVRVNEGQLNSKFDYNLEQTGILHAMAAHGKFYCMVTVGFCR